MIIDMVPFNIIALWVISTLTTFAMLLRAPLSSIVSPGRTCASTEENRMYKVKFIGTGTDVKFKHWHGEKHSHWLCSLTNAVREVDGNPWPSRWTGMTGIVVWSVHTGQVNSSSTHSSWPTVAAILQWDCALWITDYCKQIWGQQQQDYNK